MGEQDEADYQAELAAIERLKEKGMELTPYFASIETRVARRQRKKRR